MGDVNDLAKLAELKEKGVISEAEFKQQKEAFLSQNLKTPVNGEQKSRIAYILLALFLGGLGIHNFYAGYTGKAVAQLLITLLLFWLIVPILIVWIWVIVEICTVTKDANGVPFN